MEPDPRLRNPEFNPIDDPATASSGSIGAENTHRFITLFDRLCLAHATSDYPANIAGHALAMLEVRAKLFGVKIDT